MILDELAAYAAYRVEEAKKKLSPEEIRTQAEHLPKGDFRFEKALKKKGMSFICEVKKASPSKGVIAEEFPYTEIARAYEAAGADCVSVLTEPKWFLGSDDIFREIREAISLPMIRKDFTVDPYQIYEAKLMGADAVLLICALPTFPSGICPESCSYKMSINSFLFITNLHKSKFIASDRGLIIRMATFYHI